MKKFSGKFEEICERALERGQTGFLNGDYVKIKKDAMKNAIVQGMTAPVRAIIESFIKSDAVLRVSCVKSGHTDASHGPVDAAHVPSATMWVDTVLEYAPGMWREPLTLPQIILEFVPVELANGFPQYQDSLKRPNSNSSNREYKSDGTNQTQSLDGNRNLTGKNVTIPATSPVDGREYTKLHEAGPREENEIIMERYQSSQTKEEENEE